MHADGTRYVHSVASSVFAGTPRRFRLWAMLNAYADDSGTHADSRAFIVAVLLAPPRRWERLSAEWLRALDKARAPCFHATDCATGGGEFRGWDRENRNKLYAKLAQIVAKHACFRAWSVAFTEDYFQIFRREGDKFLYQMCLEGCANTIKTVARRRGIKIPYVFDRGGLGGGFARSYLEEHADQFGVGAVSTDSKGRLPPLQAADLHAYEVYKHFTDMMTERRAVEDGPRGSFGCLWKIAEAGGGGIVWNDETIPVYIKARKARAPVFELPLYCLNETQRLKIQPYRLKQEDFVTDDLP